MDEVNERESFLEDLKYQTATAHKKLEGNRLSKAILSDTVGYLDYQLYLSALYGINKACEVQVFPVLEAVIPDLRERAKSSLIIKDLIATGFSDKAIQELPIYQFPTPDTAQALGIMYVMEGSTLGGRILYKHIYDKLGLSGDCGASYFAGYGTQTGMMWKSFVTILDQEAGAGSFQQAIIRSAITTFEVIDKALSQMTKHTHEND